MTDVLGATREQQISLQANVAAVLFILALASFCGFRLLGLSQENMSVVACGLTALVTAGVFGLSPKD